MTESKERTTGMKIHQIKVDFQVTEQIKRYVYVYLIEGKYCYLIDSGVAGCQQQIMDRIQESGKELSDLKGIFLTHAHPDHIGTAGWFQERTGCRVYAGVGECAWIEDIDLQFRERPIPNFYQLAGQSVKVDCPVRDGAEISLDESFSVKVVGTAGHSVDEISYQLQDSFFIGDSVPVPGDIPIYIDYAASRKSLELIRNKKECTTFYPAWDHTYDIVEIAEKIKAAVSFMDQIDRAVNTAQKNTDNIQEIQNQVCSQLQMPMLCNNPLFIRTIKSHLQYKSL